MEIPNSGEQFNLKWNNHLANFIQTFIEHQNGESLVDVTLSCDGQYIKAHKLILSACSDYFHSIFQVHNNVSHPFILLNGVRFTDLKYILHFMYHGEVKVVDTDLPSVLALGETLQIKGLSSVKLRDVPPDQNVMPSVASTNPDKIYTKNPSHGQSTKSLPILPSEIPYHPPKISVKSNYINSQSTNQKVSLDSSNNISQKNKTILNLTMKTPTEMKAADESNVISISQSPPFNRSSSELSINHELKTSTPKPQHAFMIFTNEWRKKLSVEYPGKSNKDISIMLGNMWKNVQPEVKSKYYKLANKRTKFQTYTETLESTKRKSDVLNDSTNINVPSFTLDPMDVVEIQESNTDSE
ncbi:uncharacterized protein LOC143193924 [Rhynchophorus ferrugineus]|uniref:uncharacterized protein LOC143193924 n=1 Tax=Rhynchophorus ferrugineus TaxID=354439 RepID=UPI003FCE3249